MRVIYLTKTSNWGVNSNNRNIRLIIEILFLFLFYDCYYLCRTSAINSGVSLEPSRYPTQPSLPPCLALSCLFYLSLSCVLSCLVCFICPCLVCCLVLFLSLVLSCVVLPCFLSLVLCCLLLAVSCLCVYLPCLVFNPPLPPTPPSPPPYVCSAEICRLCAFWDDH